MNKRLGLAILEIAGDSKGMGFLVHSCLAVLPQKSTPELLGLAAQAVWTREATIHRGNETRIERAKRRTESDIWAETVEKIGPPPAVQEPQENLQWVSVSG